ncbi:unnamed protein product [Camellia sinensis]
MGDKPDKSRPLQVFSPILEGVPETEADAEAEARVFRFGIVFHLTLEIESLTSLLGI